MKARRKLPMHRLHPQVRLQIKGEGTCSYEGELRSHVVASASIWRMICGICSGQLGYQLCTYLAAIQSLPHIPMSLLYAVM